MSVCVHGSRFEPCMRCADESRIASLEGAVARLESENANLRAEVELVVAGRESVSGDREALRADVARLEAENDALREVDEHGCDCRFDEACVFAVERDRAWLAAWDAEWRAQNVRSGWVNTTREYGKAKDLIARIEFYCGRGASGQWAVQQIRAAREGA